MGKPLLNYFMKPISGLLPKLLFSFALSANISMLASESADSIRVEVERVFESFDTPRPIQLLPAPGDSGRNFLVLQEGKVLLTPAKGNDSSFDTIMDITKLELIDNAFEEGLLGIAFHPQVNENRLFYAYHTLQNPKRTVLVEHKFSDLKTFSLDENHMREILSIPQPYWNHNSGIPCFGPDGHLYLSTGDGGNANDPHDHSQNTFSLLGKVLRIDVDSRSGALPYGIPSDNPFVGQPGYREEIWAYGLRNPWRLHWDFDHQRLFCADVGQHLWEEVNLIEKGGNYGWNLREGSHPFPGNPDSNKTFDSIAPIFEYGHDHGTSISGGCIYLGAKEPSLKDKYLFGDWGTGKSWALRLLEEQEVSVREVLFISNNQKINPEPTFKNGKPKSPFKPVNFCMGAKGDLFILDWQGMIYRLI